MPLIFVYIFHKSKSIQDKMTLYLAKHMICPAKGFIASEHDIIIWYWLLLRLMLMHWESVLMVFLF
jgi:hypothetical protein